MSSYELIVHSTPMVEVEGETSIPTVLSYTGGRCIIGHDALESVKKSPAILNEDFKLDLGNYDPSASRRKRFPTESGTDKSAGELTSDFFNELIKQVNTWLVFHGLEASPSLLLAEPLKDPREPDWIKNYRSNIERILIGKGFTKEQIDFLPEPFAVFQYYRYGYRHPALADRRVHRALVLDFGGGTFDACVVESKKDGDISRSGRNSNPLGAASSPIGGFEINRQLAEHIAFQVCKGHEAKVKKGLEIYKRWRRTSEDLKSHTPEYLAFVLNFHRLVHDVESGKIAVSKNIHNWKLDASSTFSYPFRSPRNFFEIDPGKTTVQVRSSDLLNIFAKRLWPELRKTISQTLKMAQEELVGAPLNVVLLSGGSAGFGWLRELLMRDFTAEVDGAEILTLPDYREVVAKGLAIECARRFYNARGDFGTTTYNRLCLVLEADDHGQEVPRFSPRFGAEKAVLSDGVLLPSSTALGSLIEKPLKWKFRLDGPPKKKLNYFFLRSSLDSDDMESLQNVEETCVFTPTRTTFDSQLQVELTVCSDGTAIPQFIYKSGKNGLTESAVRGRPFYLDMTNVGSGSPATAYLGIDFGTSNSAVAYLSEQTMERHKVRSQDASWLNLHELVTPLPFPIAKALSRVIGGTAGVQSEDGFLRVLEFMEAAFSILAYAAYLELCTLAGNKSKMLKGFTQRSIGPLWGLLRDALSRMGKQCVMLAPAMKLLHPETKNQIDRLVEALNERKHHKGSSAAVDLMSAMTLVGNICNDVFGKSVFGFFEGVQRKRFGKEYCGRFRLAHGAVQPFSVWLTYEGEECFSDYQPFLVDLTTKKAISMEPLLFWDQPANRTEADESSLFVLDRQQGLGYDFKTVGLSSSINTGRDSRYTELQGILDSWRQSDPELMIHALRYLEHDEEN